MTCIYNLFGTSTAWTGTNNNIFNGYEFGGAGDFCTGPGGAPAMGALGGSWEARQNISNDFAAIFGPDYGNIFVG